MQTVTLSVGDKPYTVTACVVLCGKDIAVVIGGGEASHIGAAALASPRPSLKILLRFPPVPLFYAVWDIRMICLPERRLCVWRVNLILMLP